MSNFVGLAVLLLVVVVIILGILRGVCIRKIPDQENHSQVDWRDIKEKFGLRFGRRGACWYIIDDEGNRLSEGFHEFRNLSNDAKLGRRGALYYLLDENHQIISEGYFQIEPYKGNNYLAKKATRDFVLDPSGRVVSSYRP